MAACGGVAKEGNVLRFWSCQMSQYHNRVINSGVARLYQPDGRGQPPEVVRSLGSGLPGQRPRDLIEEGLVGRALATTRAALEPLDRLRGAAQ